MTRIKHNEKKTKQSNNFQKIGTLILFWKILGKTRDICGTLLVLSLSNNIFVEKKITHSKKNKQFENLRFCTNCSY